MIPRISLIAVVLLFGFGIIIDVGTIGFDVFRGPVAPNPQDFGEVFANPASCVASSAPSG